MTTPHKDRWLKAASYYPDLYHCLSRRDEAGEWLRARAAENTAHNEVVFAVAVIGLATLLLGVIAWFAS